MKPRLRPCLAGVLALAALTACSTPRYVYVARDPGPDGWPGVRLACRNVDATFQLTEIFEPPRGAGTEVFYTHPDFRRGQDEPVEFRVLKLDLVVADRVIPAELRLVTWSRDEEGKAEVTERSPWILAQGRYLPTVLWRDGAAVDLPDQSPVFRFTDVPRRWSDLAALHGRIEVLVDGAVVETLVFEMPLVQEVR